MGRDKEIGLQIKIISNLIKRKMLAAMPQMVDGLTEMQAQIISYLHNNGTDKDIFQKDVEEQFSIRRSTASRILSTLEEKHIITRESVAHDARLKKVSLTPASYDCHMQMRAKIGELELLMREGLTSEEIDLFFAITKKIIQNLK